MQGPHFKPKILPNHPRLKGEVKFFFCNVVQIIFFRVRLFYFILKTCSIGCKKGLLKGKNEKKIFSRVRPKLFWNWTAIFECHNVTFCDIIYFIFYETGSRTQTRLTKPLSTQRVWERLGNTPKIFGPPKLKLEKMLKKNVKIELLEKFKENGKFNKKW